MKATLILNDDATPKFCKLHKLSFALKPVVGDELDHLETQGFTKKVSHMWSFKNYDQPIVKDQKPLKDWRQLVSKKYKFFQSQVQYLGHIIDKEGIWHVPQKIKAVVDMPKPNNPKELCSFLGMINYVLWSLYTRFSFQMCDLLHKEAKWKWIKLLIKLLTSTETLSHYDGMMLAWLVWV